MVQIKNNDDIIKIKKAANIWKQVKADLLTFVKIGVSLNAIDEYAATRIKYYGAEPAFYHYRGFPSNICLSVNETIIHGIASDYVLKDGDLITLDIGILFEHHYCDAAFSIILGEGNKEAHKINQVCYNSLMEAIKIIKPNITTNYDIAATIQDYVEINGYEVIRDFTGHGCGNEIHEDPIIANYRSRFFKKEILVPGMVICIEPMIMTKSNAYIIDDKNKWSVIAKNKQLTCHWEHMILITETGYEILTA